MSPCPPWEEMLQLLIYDEQITQAILAEDTKLLASMVAFHMLYQCHSIRKALPTVWTPLNPCSI